MIDDGIKAGDRPIVSIVIPYLSEVEMLRGIDKNGIYKGVRGRER